MFTPDELAAHAKQALETGMVTPERRGAFFTGLTTEGVKAGLALKVGGEWSIINLYAAHEFHGDHHNEAGINWKAVW